MGTVGGSYIVQTLDKPFLAVAGPLKDLVAPAIPALGLFVLFANGGLDRNVEANTDIVEESEQDDDEDVSKRARLSFCF